MSKPKARSSAKVPWQVTLMTVCFLAPQEFSLYLFGLRLPPHRLVILALLPMAAWRLLCGRGVKLRFFDVLFIAFNGWILASFMGHGEGTQGLVFGGSLVVESIGGYLVARVFVRDAQTFKAALGLLVLAVAFAGALALPEMLLGQTFTHNFLRSIFGGDPVPQMQVRLGLARAYSVFDHPIHLGTFCASGLAMVWFATAREPARWRYLAVLAIAVVTPLSSAPMLCFGLQVALLSLEYVTRGMHSRVAVFLAVVFGLYASVTIVSDRTPFAIIATGFTLDSWTGFYRLKIWEFGLETVSQNIWFGIGLGDWERPVWMVSKTVDAFWLLLMMRSGVPAVVLIVLAIAVLIYRVTARIKSVRDKDVRRLARGWLISATALIMIAFTVHYWNALYAYFFYVLGLGGWLADPLKAKKTVPVAERLEESLPADAPIPRPRREPADVESGYGHGYGAPGYAT